MKFLKIKKRIIAMMLAAGSVIAPIGVMQGQITPSVATPANLQAGARAAGATHINVRQRSDGGTVLHGGLDGRKFVIDIPPGWKGQAAVFARGQYAAGLGLSDHLHHAFQFQQSVW